MHDTLNHAIRSPVQRLKNMGSE